MNIKMYPKHVGIIPDGNRRYAKEQGLPNAIAYAKGIQVIEDLAEWALRDTSIEYLTVYAFSTENARRGKAELGQLFDMYEKEFYRVADSSKVQDNGIRIRVIGAKELLPKGVQDAIAYAEEQTSKFKKKTLSIAMGYGGREELLHAIKDIAKEVSAGDLKLDSIDEHLVKEHLYTNGMPYPELIIRTKEHRLSNFLTWQSAYSELVFVDKHFPEMTVNDFKAALLEFEKRERRFGK
ncbi:polyprenyl diphosphate synthase [Candidatus Undinarchaeota archaeon]